MGPYALTNKLKCYSKYTRNNTRTHKFVISSTIQRKYSFWSSCNKKKKYMMQCSPKKGWKSSINRMKNSFIQMMGGGKGCMGEGHMTKEGIWWNMPMVELVREEWSTPPSPQVPCSPYSVAYSSIHPSILNIACRSFIHPLMDERYAFIHMCLSPPCLLFNPLPCLVAAVRAAAGVHGFVSQLNRPTSSGFDLLGSQVWVYWNSLRTFRIVELNCGLRENVLHRDLCRFNAALSGFF